MHVEIAQSVYLQFFFLTKEIKQVLLMLDYRIHTFMAGAYVALWGAGGGSKDHIAEFSDT